jgi:hypothetical protein
MAESGRLRAATFADYWIPTLHEMPNEINAEANKNGGPRRGGAQAVRKHVARVSRNGGVTRGTKSRPPRKHWPQGRADIGSQATCREDRLSTRVSEHLALGIASFASDPRVTPPRGCASRSFSLSCRSIRRKRHPGNSILTA